MSDYNWCHGPSCHTQQTQSRVRGSGDNKVLRTIKIPLHSEYRRTTIWAYFCNQRCLFDYLNKHMQVIAAIAPRSKALETPVKVKKEKYENYRYRYDSVNGQQRIPFTSTRTIINSVDND